MLALIIEAALLLALIVLACAFGGIFWLLWVFAALDFLLLLVTLFFKLKKGRIVCGDDTGKKEIPHLDETFDYNGHQFEEYVASVYKRLGYKILSINKSRDQGIDIIVRRVFRTGLQVKCYNKPVGNKAVQEAAAGKKYYGLKKAAVVTNSIFTASATQLAAKNKVRLIDRRELAKMVKKANGE